MKKNIYFVQANYVYGSGSNRTVYLPYAAGCIVANAFADPAVSSRYNFKRFIYTRESIDESVASLECPYLVAFSCSVWNMEYNKVYAKRLKEIYPDCVIVFGGHQVPPGSGVLGGTSADILIHGAGEAPFRALLLALADGTPLDRVGGISFRQGKEYVTTPQLYFSCDTFPSPYLTGVFDPILNDGIRFSAIVETNRGCPNHCAFCDWGFASRRVTLFPLEKVYAELNWIASHKIDYIFCGDGNFGLFDRDEEICDYIVALKKRTGYPEKFRVCYTKNREEFVLKISKKFSENALDKSQTLSFQSLNPEVLQNIGRSNMTLEHFRYLMDRYTRAGISAFSELIVGLPGETRDSFREGICKLLEYGQHTAVSTYLCELLPNSILGQPETIERFGIRCARVPFSQIHCETDEADIREYSTVVTAAESFTVDDWIDSVVFSSYIQGFHGLGLTRLLAIYLRHACNISYLDFYSGLLRFSADPSNAALNAIYEKQRRLTAGVSRGENAWVSVAEGYGNITWGFDEIVFLDAVRNIDPVYSELRAYLDGLLPNKEQADALMRYQYAVVRKPYAEHFSETFDRDFPAYFIGNHIGDAKLPEKRKTILTVESDSFSSPEEYAKKLVWFGRRDDAALWSEKNGEVNVSYGDDDQ